MKKLSTLIFLIFAFSISAFADKGTVAFRMDGCDHFVVETTKGDYSVMEWFSGNDPDKGDEIVGKLRTFGFEDLYNTTTEDDLRVYIEEWGMDKKDAIAEMYEKCE